MSGGQPQLSGGQRVGWSIRPWDGSSAERNVQLCSTGPGRIRPYYDRLVPLKNKGNPTNFFRMCQNIEPSS